MTAADSSSGRRGQARTRLARIAVIRAAGQLFLERGYGATTIESISDLADVPPATVYRLFSSKQGILKALLDTSIAGDDDDAPVVERPGIQAILAEPEPALQLARFVAFVVQLNIRVAPLYRILIGAADTDPGAAALVDTLGRQRQQGQSVIARALAGAGALRPGLRERDAADVIHALLSPELYRLLVLDRGWTSERYQQWLTETMIHQLLAPPGSTGRSAPSI